jgi:hypothetical protein
LASARRWNECSDARRFALLIASRDPVFFVNEFAWTYDPREESPFIPFDLFEEQERAIRWLQDCAERGVDGILEKSRDMGATWITAAFAVWMWLFRPGSAVGFGSRKLELVDRIGDPKSIFEKIRFLVRNLPAWLMEAQANGYDPRSCDSYCKLINPATGATITGEGGDEIGRGGRTTVYFVDEAAFLPRPLLVEQALSANARCKIWVSTPRGANNPFAQKRLGGRHPVFTLHWRHDPRKSWWAIVPNDWEPALAPNGELELGEQVHSHGEGEPPQPPEGWRVVYPWYEQIRLRESPITVAQEYDIDYTASLEGVAIPAKWLRACVGLRLRESERGDAGFDVAAGGDAENAYVYRRGPCVKRVVRWRGDDPTASTFKVVQLAEQDGAARLFYDSVGVGAGVGGAIRLVQRRLPFVWSGVNVGKPPSDAVWPDRTTSRERFANLKAELWWRVRCRAERSYQRVFQGIMHPDEECLSLPEGSDTETLIAQLSGVRYFETDTGRIAIESKSQLRERGVASPDVADALILSFAPAPPRRASVAGSSGAVPAWPGAAKPSPARARRGNAA